MFSRPIANNPEFMAEKLRLTKLLKNEQGFDQLKSQCWSETENDLFFYAGKLFRKDKRAISYLMASRDLRNIGCSVQKKVEKYEGLENDKDPKIAERANIIKVFGSKKKTDKGVRVTIKGGCNKDFSNFLFRCKG